jgi:polyisoprenoid-binding protein YceI
MISACAGYAQTAGLDHLVADPVYSTIQFSVPIANGLTRVTGKFNVFNIDIEMVDNDITKSRIKAVIKVHSLITGNNARDRVLMSNVFFDVAKFPEITFVSEKIVKTKNGYIATGQFQMHGITRPLELPFSITGTNGNEVIGISCRYSILRSAYKLGTEYKHANYDNFIENEVGIEIDFWTKRKPRERR